jgi:hypothetical protein
MRTGFLLCLNYHQERAREDISILFAYGERRTYAAHRTIDA